MIQTQVDEKHHLKTTQEGPSWWFQPISKVSVKIGSSPQVEIIITDHWKHHKQGACSFKPPHFEPQQSDVLFKRQPTKRASNSPPNKGHIFLVGTFSILCDMFRCYLAEGLCIKPGGPRWFCMFAKELNHRKTHTEPKNAGLENDIPFRMGDFSGSMLVFRGILKPKKHTNRHWPFFGPSRTK